MIKYKVFSPDKNNKISFTKAELETLLNEVYNEGYSDGKSSNWIVNYGCNSTPYYPLYNTATTTTATNYTITANNTDTNAGTIALNEGDTTITYGDKK